MSCLIYVNYRIVLSTGACVLYTIPFDPPRPNRHEVGTVILHFLACSDCVGIELSRLWMIRDSLKETITSYWWRLSSQDLELPQELVIMINQYLHSAADLSHSLPAYDGDLYSIPDYDSDL